MSFPSGLVTNSSTEEMSVNSDYKLYPNPASEELKIFSLNNKKPLAIEIYNSLGQLIMNTVSDLEKINISSLQQGMYFLKIYNDEEANTSILKFIKQ